MTCDCRDMRLSPSRRGFLAAAGSFVAWAGLPRIAKAAGRDPRFVVVILRGAMDGLAFAPPVADPDYAALRGDLAIGADGREPALRLDGFFGLNSAMPKLHARYTAGEALIVHASATSYRDRSHFDGQDVLESGLVGPGGETDGWLNRVALALPASDRVGGAAGLAASPTVPLIMRGAAPILTWSPANLRPATADTFDRLLQIYQHGDAELAHVLKEGLDTAALASGGMSDLGTGRGIADAFRELAEGAGRILSKDDGPRLAALSYDGWDTHASEGAESGRLANLFAALDGALDGLATAMAPVWRDTVVAVATEFGRTARTNGTDGTDHGTATAALLLGGAVRGGRVLADWPGLKESALFEGRDLAPTMDLRAVFKGVLRDHLGLDQRMLGTTVFPGSLAVLPQAGLVA
jgi:uncharacterized protein (DUF1501 family)